MNPPILDFLWLMPVLPLLAAAVTALMPARAGKAAAWTAILAMAGACVVAWLGLSETLGLWSSGADTRLVHNFDWLVDGASVLRMGWVLDPLSASMCAMVATVSLLIFIFSAGYMADDARMKQFFCFLSLFGAAMLGLVIANSLLLLFMCWELVGLASYLLIGFWFQKPEAAAACRKAFITTRVGDIGFLVGILWIANSAGTLLFFDGGNGFLESGFARGLGTEAVFLGLAPASLIGLLLFCGAAGKSGQVPLHVWLPDAMEGPTPVSALIHAATMVAAGVFLMARVAGLLTAEASTVVAFVGAATALYGALVGVAQWDIKRILAYSTVSQLGYMMLAVGTGGWIAGMFHLIAHACFKALLFLGSGSVIHGCHHEQDIRRMGGLSRKMRLTFATYGAGMLALCGFPLVTSGFWSKDAILHVAHNWHVSHLPFWMGLCAAALTAFYMTRLMCTVFFGPHRGDAHHEPHESPAVMTLPLVVLAVPSLLLGFLATPAWDAFGAFLAGEKHLALDWARLGEAKGLMLGSSAVVLGALAIGWWVYGRRTRATADEADPIARTRVGAFVFRHLENRLWFDEFYDVTVIPLVRGLGCLACGCDRRIWGAAVAFVALCGRGLAALVRFWDDFGLDGGFQQSCDGVRAAGAVVNRGQGGKVQDYLYLLAWAFAIIFLVALVAISAGA